MMYKKILVALENSPTDQALIPYIIEFAEHFHSHLLLLHVADGWVARNYDHLQLKASEEMKNDCKYLEKVAQQIRDRNLKVSSLLALGNPPEEILTTAEKEHCDLIAMTSHGHRFFADFIYGSTIEEVRHQTAVPILIIKGNP